MRSLFSSIFRSQKNELNRRVPYWILSAGLLTAGFSLVALAMAWLTYVAWSLIKQSGLGEAESAALVLLLIGGIAGAIFTALGRLRKEELNRRKQAFLDRQSELSGMEAQGTQLINAVSDFSKDIVYTAKEALDPKELISKHATTVVTTAAILGFMFGVRRVNALRVNALFEESKDNNLEGALQ